MVEIQAKQNKGAEILYISRSSKETIPSTVDLTNCVLFERKEKGNIISEIYIRHPYLSKKYSVNYDENEFLDTTKDIWENAAYDRIHPTATIIVSNNEIIGKAGNGLDGIMHTVNDCERKKLNMPTGQGYHLCDGTHLTKNHSESKAVRKIKETDNDNLLDGSTAYMYGHWWSCKDCSDAMEKAGVKKLFLSKEWTKKFLGI